MKTSTKVLFYIICAISLISCYKSAERSTKFTPEQVASLGLDSTKSIKVVSTDSIININLNPFLKQDSLRIGEMLKSIKFIPLETTDNSLVANIEEILVTDSNLYIADSYKGGSLLIFDKNGKFLKRIIRGQGPEEILELKSFAFNREKQELIMYHSRFLSFYTPDGKFKRKEMLPFNALDFTVIPNGYLFRNSQGPDNRHLGFSQIFQILITNEDFKLEYIGVPYLYSKENNFEGKKYISLSEKDINLTFKFNDTIFQYVNNGSLKAKYVLNYRDKKIPDRVIKELPVMDFFKETRDNNYYFFMGKYIENNTNDFFELSNNYIKTNTRIFRNKETGNLLGGTILTTNQSNFPYINIPVTSYKSYFVSYFLPEKMDILKEIIKQSELLSDEDRAILQNIEDDDNPVLVFYELKDF